MRQWMTMPQRLDGGLVLAGLGGLILIVSLFLNWFDVPGDGGITAWTAFELDDLLLAALGAAALAAALPIGALDWQPRLPWIGAAAFVVVAVSLVNRPPAAAGLSLDVGAWLAFAGASLILVGGILATTRISIEISVRAPDEVPPDEEPRDEEEDILDEADDLFEEDEGSEEETTAMPAVGRRGRAGTRA
jgi:hypothetical protein